MDEMLRQTDQIITFTNEINRHFFWVFRLGGVSDILQETVGFFACNLSDMLNTLETSESL